MIYLKLSCPCLVDGHKRNGGDTSWNMVLRSLTFIINSSRPYGWSILKHLNSSAKGVTNLSLKCLTYMQVLHTWYWPQLRKLTGKQCDWFPKVLVLPCIWVFRSICHSKGLELGDSRVREGFDVSVVRPHGALNSVCNLHDSRKCFLRGLTS